MRRWLLCFCIIEKEPEAARRALTSETSRNQLRLEQDGSHCSPLQGRPAMAMRLQDVGR